MILFGFQVAFGIFLILILVMLGINNSRDKKKPFDDEKALKTITDTLEENEYDNFELESIVSMNDPNITSVVISAGYLQIGLEINNNSGKILNIEKIARQ